MIARLGPLLLGALCPTVLLPQTLDDVRARAAAGDTAGAIAAVEALLKREQRHAEAQWVAGLLYLSQHVPGARVSAARRKAEEHFRYATRFGPDSAKYWVSLADLFRGEDLMFVRRQVPDLLRRAADRVAAAPTDSMAAEVGYRVARLEWERHEHFGRRHAAADAGEGVAMPGLFAEWKYWEEFLDHGVRSVPVDGENIVSAEGALWQVLRAHPGDVRAAGLLAVLLGETYRWAEAVPVARRLVAAVPDSGRAWAILGLTYTRTGRWAEATAAFETAFARMAPAERAPYEDLGRIMRRADRIRWEQMEAPGRAWLESLYWQAAQPLVLSGVNEVQSEFYARITYADHRWTDQWMRFRGYETDIGSVYIAYGPPDHWLMFDRSFITWVYPRTHYRFQFNLTPGFTRARFAGESREVLRVAQEESPARFDNIPLYRDLDTILVQVSRFRGRGDTAAIAVFGAIPLARLAGAGGITDMEMATGAIVTDSMGRELQRDRRGEIVRDAGPDGVIHRSWRLALPPGQYVLRSEAHVPALDRGARSVGFFDVRRFPAAGLSLSDVLAANRVAPRDSLASRWTDYLIQPNGGRFLPGSTIGLLWETYNLSTDSAGTALYDVELRITVEAIERRSFFARIVGGVADATGLSAVGDDRVSLNWSRSAAVGPEGVVVEHVEVELRDAPEGRYTIWLAVGDRRTGAVAVSERTILVLRDPPARRQEYTTFR
jgi:GWxTD domain-containing protein